MNSVRHFDTSIDACIGRCTATITQAAAVATLLVFAGCVAISPPPPDTGAEAAPDVAAEPPAEVAPGTVRDVLGALPDRESRFFDQFKQQVLSGDWDWVIERAEPVHHQELVGRLGMDDESYLTFLLRMGESFQTRVRRDDAEPGYFSPYHTVEVVFTGVQQQPLSTIVEGLFYNRQGRSIDFTVTLLSELQDLKITGAYY